MVRKTYPALADPGETAVQEDALADIAMKKLEFNDFIETAIKKTKEEVQQLLNGHLVKGKIAVLECPNCKKESCIKLTSKAGHAYWKCQECDLAFSDVEGKPGTAFEKREDGQSRPKPQEGPVCPACKQKTGKYFTRNEKPYFRCQKCNKNYWPDFKNKAKIGNEWKTDK
jgi:DNA topoisomerase-3